MFRHLTTISAASCVLGALLTTAGCGDEPSTPAPAGKPEAKAPPSSGAPAAAAKPAEPDSLPTGIMLALAHFIDKPDAEGKLRKVPGPARVEFLYRKDGRWQTEVLEDEDSNVFHKAMVFDWGSGPALTTLAGTEAVVKSWRSEGGKLVATEHWREDFGGTHNRMRDAEAGDLYGDGKTSLAVATHDQGVVAILRPQAEGGFEVKEIDRKPNIFVHEIELGDLDGDGALEVYATPSEPNRLDGTPQKGEVLRYTPSKSGGPAIVADLGTRHAKEILVDDVDGDGRDELYVSVEGETEGKGANKRLTSPVEIRRYDADTPAGEGVVIATLQDALCRFLTAGDIDGDGKKEMVAASFSAGVWLLRPGADPKAAWTRELIDRDSGGFEHASILTDLDGDGTDELYVASDDDKELRRYVWNGSEFDRETIYVRPDKRAVFTWNLMPFPVTLLP